MSMSRNPAPMKIPRPKSVKVNRGRWKNPRRVKESAVVNMSQVKLPKPEKVKATKQKEVPLQWDLKKNQPL